MKNKQRFAFSLSEFLIVLSVISVVAAMTVPSLIQNAHEQELKMAWKSAFSDMSQIFNNLIVIKGDLSSVCKQNVSFKDAFVSYVKPLNSCGEGNSAGCVSSPWTLYKNLKGNSAISPSYFDDGQILLPNGAFVMFENAYSSPSPPCIAWYDVNGYKKGPNRLGLDVFGVQFFKNAIAPLGDPRTSSAYGTCDRTDATNMSGGGCASYVLKDQDY